MTLLVEQSHAGINLQDAGRRGVAGLGVTSGGAADLQMALLCNALAGNCPQVLLPLLEIPLGGLVIRASRPVVLACCGIGFQPTVNGRSVAAWRSIYLNSGDVLATGYSRQAARAYIAVQGGFAAKAVLGSCSAVTREQIGGVDGQAAPIHAGQSLSHVNSQQYQAVSLPYVQQPRLPALLTLDIVLGAQWQALQQDAYQQGRDLAVELLQRLYKVSQQADRMGIRLTGAALPAKSLTLYSEGLATGAVQLPPDGQPIVMLVDHQTIGGYPKLGSITPHSVNLLAQALPGQLVRFRAVNASLALQQERLRQQTLALALQEIWQQWQ